MQNSADVLKITQDARFIIVQLETILETKSFNSKDNEILISFEYSPSCSESNYKFVEDDVKMYFENFVKEVKLEKNRVSLTLFLMEK